MKKAVGILSKFVVFLRMRNRTLDEEEGQNIATHMLVILVGFKDNDE
jgi:hypothetical protein